MTQIQKEKSELLEKILEEAVRATHCSPVEQYRLQRAYKKQSLANLKDTARSFGILPFEETDGKQCNV
jgi:hypothetical protein